MIAKNFLHPRARLSRRALGFIAAAAMSGGWRAASASALSKSGLANLSEAMRGHIEREEIAGMAALISPSTRSF